MASKKRTTSPIQRLIVRLRDKERYTLEKIGDHLGMGKSAIREDLRAFQEPACSEKPWKASDNRRKSYSGLRMDRKLFLESKKDPKRTASEVLAAAGAPEISVSTVLRRQREKGLYGIVAAHKSYVSKTNMEKHSQKVRKPDDLFDAVSREWAALPLQTLETLVKSMPRRCKAVLEANGTPTKY
uniref:RNA polymerase sigma-70 region 4 domain-containing protein n=1 Tax=Plectus sambesii TaxID=2011161 RepID=A0A914W923_9BILA